MKMFKMLMLCACVTGAANVSRMSVKEKARAIDGKEAAKKERPLLAEREERAEQRGNALRKYLAALGERALREERAALAERAEKEERERAAKEEGMAPGRRKAVASEAPDREVENSGGATSSSDVPLDEANAVAEAALNELVDALEADEDEDDDTQEKVTLGWAAKLALKNFLQGIMLGKDKLIDLKADLDGVEGPTDIEGIQEDIGKELLRISSLGFPRSWKVSQIGLAVSRVLSAGTPAAAVQVGAGSLIGAGALTAVGGAAKNIAADSGEDNDNTEKTQKGSQIAMKGFLQGMAKRVFGVDFRHDPTDEFDERVF